MPMDQKVVDLFYAMTSYSKSIYANIQELCYLEKAGKKQEKAYFEHINVLKRLLKQEKELYKKNIDLVFNKRGEFAYLAINNCSDANCNMYDLLSWFNDSIIFERIKSKLQYYVGIQRTFGDDLLRNLKIEEYVERKISEKFLDDSFLSDIQKVSMYYMNKDCEYHERSIDYKYLSALLFNFDSELVDNYFEIPTNTIYLDSSLTHTLSGIYEEIYRINSDEVMKKRFDEIIDFIIVEDSSLDDDSDYKIEIALNYLKSVLDLLPLDQKDELYNDFIMHISDNFGITNELKLRIINALNEAGYSRKLLNYITANQS